MEPLVAMEPRRDVGVVLSGGGVNGVLMELGFLQRLHESGLWPRISAIFGTSAGALSGAMAADMAVKARPPAPIVSVWNWTGFYIGLNAGGGFGRTNASETAV